jgi:hypothetical protein
MNIYKLTNIDKDANGYDTYDSCIVAAESEEQAKMITPDEEPFEHDKYRTWAYCPELVTVTLIGVATSDVKSGVILASFNAG